MRKLTKSAARKMQATQASALPKVRRRMYFHPIRSWTLRMIYPPQDSTEGDGLAQASTPPEDA